MHLLGGDFGEDATSTHLPLDHLLVALRKRWRRGGWSRSGNVAPLSLGKDDTLSNVQNAPGSPIPKVHLAHEYQCFRFSKNIFVGFKKLKLNTHIHIDLPKAR
jgi:hypothetical protein